ncbi:MAG TPA: c-type cytochrome biogenesis protein CcsB, partial [Gammaproteobacteria bacterium]|nr:c-type cytochrome biogenesis protein CcsB [Gammaproteobacteria bacterium]
MSVSQEQIQELLGRQSFFRRLTWLDWLWAALVVAATGWVYTQYGEDFNVFEGPILFGTAACTIGLGWGWRSFQGYALAVALLSLAGVGLYGGDLARAEEGFFLKYLLSSQSAIMWMSALYVMATAAYLLGLALRSEFTSRVGTALTWSGATMGLVGLLVRWRETYLVSVDAGHIPVANLYEVFILFAVITGLLYLWYEQAYRNRSLGAFVLLVISAAVAFLLWYSFERGAHEIQPLVPALQSYWMKLHVPTNFIGYGAFALAAMVGVAYLLVEWRLGKGPQSGFAARMPSLRQLDDVMYKAIALGFAFFTVATVLGAMWAAEAWGGYWSWDPKETWALIVWLNYAAWLHLRLAKGW